VQRKEKGEHVTEPNIRQVKVTADDIDSVGAKLEKFAKGLPEGEQNVVAWLLGRASQAPVEQEVLAKAARLKPASVRDQLGNSLGVTQFDRLQPGSRFAGSSVGVTGTVMF
jgi:hypothetical protein